MLVGRDAERACLRQALADAREGRSTVLVVTGEPGVGKTALLDDAVDGADGMRVVRVIGIETEATMPFGTLFDVCRPFLGSIGELPDRQRQALQGALAMGPATAGDQFAIGAATLSLLAADARDTPLLLVIDDAQWLDDASAASLAFALRRLEADDIAVLVGLRSETDGGFDATGFTVIELARLNPADAVVLAASKRPVSRQEAQRIARVSDGNPLAVLELLGSETGVFDGLAAIPAHIEQMFAVRIQALPEETRAALLIAAVDDLGSIAVIGQATSLEALGPAEDGGLVHIGDGRLEFRHPLVRSAIYHRAAPTDRRAAHAAVAAALPPEQATRRVWHVAASLVAPDAGVADALDQIAVDAQSRRGAAAAAAAWRRAAELTPEHNARARRLLAASQAAWESGSSGSALQAADAALAACEDPLLHADIVRVHAEIQSASGGRPDELSAALRAEADAVAPLDSLRAAHLLADAVAVYPGWASEPKVELARAAREAASASDDPRFDHVLGFELTRAGSVAEAIPLLESAQCVVIADPARSSDPRALLMAADCAWFCSNPRTARALLIQAVDAGRELGLAGIVADALSDLAAVQIDLGQWDDAEARLEEAIRLGEDAGQLTTAAGAFGFQAQIAARRGDAERFERLTTATAQYGEAGAIQAYERNSRCLLALGAGRPDLAIAAREPTERYSIEQLSANALDLIEAYIRAGRVDEARARIEEVAPHVHLDEPRGAYMRCRALLADVDHFDVLFDESIELFVRLGDVFECARTRLCYGERLRRANRRLDARPELRAALETFEQLRAAPWAERARRELRASGEHRRPQTPEARDDLTPQEHQIASLAAEGRTNREIGALLFLSPRTIETHLGRVFRKLGISDRTGLKRIDSPPR